MILVGSGLWFRHLDRYLDPRSREAPTGMILRNLDHPEVKATRYQAHGGGIAPHGSGYVPPADAHVPGPCLGPSRKQAHRPC